MRLSYKQEVLVKILTQNREQHIKLFEDTKSGWEEDVQSALDALGTHEVSADETKMLTDDVRSVLNLLTRKPTSYEGEYDVAISMFDNTVDPEIQLEPHEYRKYVMDDWEWQESFKTSNSTFSKTLLSQ